MYELGVKRKEYKKDRYTVKKMLEKNTNKTNKPTKFHTITIKLFTVTSV